MKDTAQDDTVIERLEAALETGSLPNNAKEYAEHLVRRLSRPVRVSVLGLPGSGKSQLINMFLGERVVPDGAVLPTTEFAYGEKAKLIVTSADGNVVKVHGSDVSVLSGPAAAFLRIEMPVPILQQINLMEVVTDGTTEELSSGVDWVVRRTDIALWCTQEFGPTEREIWNRVPDGLKDHAFLVLSKADELSAQHMLRERVNELGSVVAEEFHSLFAVATLRALDAYNGGDVDEGLYHASGGSALTSEILRHADRGRAADLDSAHMFLARYNVDENARPTSKKPEAANAPVEASATKVVELAAAEADASAAEAADTPEQETVAPPATVATVDYEMPKVENVTLFTDSIRFLRRRGDTLAETAEGLSEGDAKGLIEHCVSAVEHLVDQFSQDESGCEAADTFIDELAEAQDMMILMQVEDGDGPAADAVTLLLQLRREMEMQLAA